MWSSQGLWPRRFHRKPEENISMVGVHRDPGACFSISFNFIRVWEMFARMTTWIFTTLPTMSLFNYSNVEISSCFNNWTVFIYHLKLKNEGSRAKCLGSLVTSKFILTAAHCFKFGDLPEHLTVEIDDGKGKGNKCLFNVWMHMPASHRQVIIIVAIIWIRIRNNHFDFKYEFD